MVTHAFIQLKTHIRKMLASTHRKHFHILRMSKKLWGCKIMRTFSVYLEGISVYPEVSSEYPEGISVYSEGISVYPWVKKAGFWNLMCEDVLLWLHCGQNDRWCSNKWWIWMLKLNEEEKIWAEKILFEFEWWISDQKNWSLKIGATFLFIISLHKINFSFKWWN